MKCKNCEHYWAETYPDCDCGCELFLYMDYDEDGDYSCNKTDAEIQERVKEIDEDDEMMLESLWDEEVEE